MLNNPDPALHLQEGTKISYLTYEDTIGEFHQLNSDGRQTPSTRSLDNRERYQAVSQPFHIPHQELLKTSKNEIRTMIFNHIRCYEYLNHDKYNQSSIFSSMF